MWVADHILNTDLKLLRLHKMTQSKIKRKIHPPKYLTLKFCKITIFIDRMCIHICIHICI